jgi:hypothetical protein
MSEANLKQAFRSLVNAHLTHASSNQAATNRNNATKSAKNEFRAKLQTYVKGLVTPEMRIRHLLNTKYITNVNKNKLIPKLGNVQPNKPAVNQKLKNLGYVVTNNRNGKSIIRGISGEFLHQVKQFPRETIIQLRSKMRGPQG